MKLSENELSRLKKLTSKKGRIQSGKFLVEGIRCVRELMASDFETEKLIVSNCLLTETGREFLESLSGMATYELNPRKFSQLSSEKSPQGIIAVAKIRPAGKLRLGEKSLICVIPKMSDPSNLGALIRSAAAFRAKLMIGLDSAEIYSPRVISASSGYVFRAEIELCETVLERLNYLHGKSFQLWGADNAGRDIRSLKEFPERIAMTIGNEAFGLAEDIKQKMDQFVKIPIDPAVDSLSAPIAGSILLSEIANRLGMIK